jgi:hypothetical protein
MMTRKHFIKFANAIRDNEQCADCVSKTSLINDLIVIFRQDNNNFDKQRFINFINRKED